MTEFDLDHVTFDEMERCDVAMLRALMRTVATRPLGASIRLNGSLFHLLPWAFPGVRNSIARMQRRFDRRSNVRRRKRYFELQRRANRIRSFQLTI